MPTAITFNYNQHLLQSAAEFILQKTRSSLPDLHAVVIFVPHQDVSSVFRQHLLNASANDYPAIMPPWIGTLKDWVTQHIPINTQYDIIDEQSRRLLFIDTLKDYPDLFREENKWQVTVALLQLFDELTLQQTFITDAEKWLQFIQNAYGLNNHRHCNREADIVYSLWHAWHQQLDAHALKDSCGDYVTRLYTAKALVEQQTLNHITDFFSIGDLHLSALEQTFIEQLINNQHCTQINYCANTHAEKNSYPNFIEQCFAGSNLKLADQTFHQRITALKQQPSEPVPFGYFAAPNEETQVSAIDLQIRLWLLNKQQNIGIICEDRKLARRLRALLERGDIPMQDLSGWSLATTQAASIIERWLQCIEEDFDSRPLLDCLKSPYLQTRFSELLSQHDQPAPNSQANDSILIKNKQPEETFNYIIYRFEHDIILHENINSNLNRYRKHLALRQKRLTHWPKNTYQKLLSIINHIETMAQPLLQLYQAKHSRPAADYFSALIQCLDLAGVTHAYKEDAAGLRILQTLNELQAATHYANPEFSWQDFRFCLANALEEKLFRPQTQNHTVKLMTLDQAELLEFDALIIAAAEPQHFPGKAKKSPFFNQAVRQALNLSSWQQDYASRFEKFKQSLFASTEIVITALAEDNGEAVPVSPWVELLMQFHQQVYGFKPLCTNLIDLLKTDSQVFRCDTKKLPEKVVQPEPSINMALLPQRFSASSHQRLIDCPYLFFCSDALKLKPLEEISTELGKADYGERVHSILQHFHNTDKTKTDKNGTKALAAFTEIIEEKNRQKAEQHLEKISRQIFSKDLEDNVLHRSWLQRWLKHIPAYISWQIEQQKNWTVDRTEQQIDVSLDETHTLYGRLDRIDKTTHSASEHNTIIDYKTGRSAKQSVIESGEDVQLSSYALLDEKASKVMYLSLDSVDFKVKPGASLHEETLQVYKQQTKSRLVAMIKAISQHQPLPAWGDKNVCQYCNFSGLCRRQQWYKSEQNDV